MKANKGLGHGSAEEIVAYHKPSNIEMPRRLLRCLNGLDWLNDEVMNFYMGLLQVCSLRYLFCIHALSSSAFESEVGCCSVSQQRTVQHSRACFL